VRKSCARGEKNFIQQIIVGGSKVREGSNFFVKVSSATESEERKK